MSAGDWHFLDYIQAGLFSNSTTSGTGSSVTPTTSAVLTTTTATNSSIANAVWSAPAFYTYGPGGPLMTSGFQTVMTSGSYGATTTSTWSGVYEEWTLQDVTTDAELKNFFSPPFLCFRFNKDTLTSQGLKVYSVNKTGISKIEPIIRIADIYVFRDKTNCAVYSFIENEMILAIGKQFPKEANKILAGIIIKAEPTKINLPIPQTSDRGIKEYRKTVKRIEKMLEITSGAES
ncbi:MAG: hypothetical protein ACW98F_00155 [Candidatus Hodarchaeales archaeon]|jgi:hypothetical protein